VLERHERPVVATTILAMASIRVKQRRIAYFLAGEQPRIPAEQQREYLKLPADQELSTRARGAEVRILPDGRVLWRLPLARLTRTFPSREAFTEQLRRG
jgi:hypothetical protein